jgi:hypothetical protein
VTSRIWYVVAAGFVATAAAIAMIGFTNMVSTIEGMLRVPMPGRAEIMLPGGPSTLYVETRSKLDGKVYETAEAFDFRCGVTDAQGKPVELQTSSSSVKYSIVGYTGRNAFDVDVANPGTFALACESQSAFVMAVGRGVGTWLVIAIVALVPALAGVVGLVVVFLRRRAQKRRVTSTA